MQIIKVPYSSNNKTKESINSPDIILNELKNISSNEKGTPIIYNSLNIEEIKINPLDKTESDYLIFESSKESFQKNDKSFFIGGDQTITLPIMRGFYKVEKNPFLIVFDALCDCNKKLEPNRCWIDNLIDSGFSPSSMILVSTRNINPIEWQFLRNFKIQIIKMDILQEDLEGICDIMMERARDSSGFYISIDLSALDPAFSPGANNNEPGGLTSRELIYLIKRLVLLSNFKGADIVELNEKKDINNITAKLGAKLLSEMI